MSYATLIAQNFLIRGLKITGGGELMKILIRIDCIYDFPKVSEYGAESE